MSLILNPKTFYQTLVGGALVILGVALKNGYTKQAGNKNAKLPGTLAFILGWVIVAYSLYSRGTISLLGKSVVTPRAILGSIGSVMVFASVMIMISMYRDKGKKPPAIFGILFALGWVIIGGSLSLKGMKVDFRSKRAVLGILATVFVLLAMLSVLPKERELKITDGMGMPLFTAGWVSLALGNALVN